MYPSTGAMEAGQMGTIVLTVTNTGSALATSISAGTLGVTDGGGANLIANSLTGPVPAVGLGIAAGGVVNFTWTFTPSPGGAGSLTFNDTVQGLGPIGACQAVAPVSAAPLSVTVDAPVNLSVSFSAINPAVLSV